MDENRKLILITLVITILGYSIDFLLGILGNILQIIILFYIITTWNLEKINVIYQGNKQYIELKTTKERNN